MNLEIFLNKILKKLDIYFYTIDNLFNKIVIFHGGFILEVSLYNKGGIFKKGNYFYFYIMKFENINNIYNFTNDINSLNNVIEFIIDIILKYESIIYKLFMQDNIIFLKNTFNRIKINKKILLILKGGGMEETVEKGFISFCNYNNLDLTILYKFGKGYWGQQLNQNGFFNELKINNTKAKFIYNEDFDDKYIDSIIDDNTEVFSFQYDYKGKNSGLNMIILSSVTDTEIDCNRYKNIFSLYESESIGYSTDKFINYEHTNIYKIFNAQNIDLLKNYNILTHIDDFILSGGMTWARDFSILNLLKGKYKGVMISDENHNIKGFLNNYRGIQNYYGFFGAFKLSKIFIACHLEKYNDDDRSKMIATAISCGTPVVVPYNTGKIVKTILNNKLGITYKNGDENDLLKKVNFFMQNKDNLKEYSKNCLIYSEKNMDINKFINLIFNNIC